MLIYKFSGLLNLHQYFYQPNISSKNEVGSVSHNFKKKKKKKYYEIYTLWWMVVAI